jgi:hypothetical protein
MNQTAEFYRSQIRIMQAEMGYCVIPEYRERLDDLHFRVAMRYCAWLGQTGSA